MKIFVPSLSRFSSGRLANGPLKYMSKEQQSDVTYVVPEEQAVKYEYGMGLAGVRARVVGSPAAGIAAVRLWCGQHAEDDKFVMVDDDVKFMVRAGADDWHLVQQKPADVAEMWSAVSTLLDEYGHVGVSPREGNNRFGVGPAPLIAENTRTLRVLAYRTADFLRMIHGRVAVMEDFDVNLQLLEAGIPNASTYYWSQDQLMTNAPGGCSTYRTHDVHEASARELQRLHPDFVRLRQKENKGGGAFGTRTEVTIAWKKAFGHAA